MSRAFSDGFGHVRRISQQNDPEGNLQLRGFVFFSFFDIIRTGLVSEQLVEIDRRRALGSSGGQHERVEDRGGAIWWGHEILLEVRAFVGLAVCEQTADGSRPRHLAKGARLLDVGVKAMWGVETSFFEPLDAVCSLLLDALADFFVGWPRHPCSVACGLE